MLYRSTFFTLSLLYCCCAYGQKPDCKRFKNGSFKLVNEEGVTFYIVRKGRLQTETFAGKEGSSTFKVKWINDCTYTLTPTKKTHKQDTSIADNAVLTVQIIETTDSSYIQRSTANFADLELTNEVVRIK